jgi:phosphohistidine phosphatase SixA
LSKEGEEQARLLGEKLAAQPERPVLVLTSPLLRARETGAAIARATGAELRSDARLAPGSDAEALLDALDGLAGPVAVVGHQPDCSEMALALTGADPGFSVAGVLPLDLQP